MLEIYKNIKTRRKQLGMTQEELAKKTGYTNKSSIATIEAGKVDLPHSKIIEFANALSIAPNDLLGWSDFEYDEDSHTWDYSENKNQKYIDEFTELSRELSEDDLKRIIAIARTFANREE